jgi:hypothetical protein
MEAWRAWLTPEQDAKIAKALNSKPGSINLAPLVLKSY